MQLQLEQECAELTQELGRHADGSPAHARVGEVNQKIAEDGKAPSLFVQVSKNVAAMTSLLDGLPAPATPVVNKLARRCEDTSSSRRTSKRKALPSGAMRPRQTKGPVGSP